MSEHENEQDADDTGPSPVTGARDVSDEQLPEDLQPTEENPLAQQQDDDEDSGMSLEPDEGDVPPPQP